MRNDSIYHANFFVRSVGKLIYRSNREDSEDRERATIPMVSHDVCNAVEEPKRKRKEKKKDRRRKTLDRLAKHSVERERRGRL